MQNQDLNRHFDEMHAEAMAKYNGRYDNAIYIAATEFPGKTVERILALQEDAMALCGSPYYHRSFLDWAPEELAFLALFL